MKAFQICGYSKSGKTTLAEKLISHFTKNGYTAASIKDIHDKHFKIDEEGKNTYRHQKAGADPVIARAANETDFLYSRQMDFSEIASRISADWLIVEGYNDFPLPKIICAKDPAEADVFYDRRTFAAAGLFSEKTSEYQGMRVYNPLDKNDIENLAAWIEEKVFPILPYVEPECCGRCGLSCAGMVEAIIQQKKRFEDCIICQSPINLKINGKDTPMVPFVQNILKNCVLGIVKELRGYEKGNTVRITIDERGSIKSHE